MDYGMDYNAGGGGGFAGRGGGSGYSAKSSGGQSGGRGGGARRSYDEQAIIPITINMALQSQADDSADGSLQLSDGRKLYHVRIVAATRSAEDHSTNVLYTVEDGTGLIDVKQWLDDNNDSTAVTEMRSKTLKDGIYLKITGQIKDYDGKKMIVADSVCPLSTGNELSHHMLEVVYSEQMARRKDSIVAPPPMMMSGVGFGGSSTTGPALQQQTNDKNALNQTLLNFIAENADSNPNGVSVSACTHAMQSMGNFSEGDVRRVLTELSAEGIVYSTIDEDHYMATSS